MSSEVKLYKGMRLSTKDGRKIGNAIILSVERDDKETHCKVKTDFGNTLGLCREEILNLFYLESDDVDYYFAVTWGSHPNPDEFRSGYFEDNLERWMEDRDKLNSWEGK